MAIATLTSYADGNVLAAADLNNNFTTLNTATVPVANGGTGLTAGTSGGVLYYSAAGTLASSGALTANGVLLGGGAGTAPTATSAGTANQVLRVPAAGGAPAFGTVAIAGGGTNSTTALNSNRIMVSSSGAIVEAGAMTNGQLLIGSTSAAPVVAALTAGGGIGVTNAAGAITVSGGWLWVGGTQTEGTTTSTTAVNLVSVTLATNIPAASPFIVKCAIRKSAGFAGNASIGLTINSTEVSTARAVFDGTNEAQAGAVEFFVPAFLTNYGRGVYTYATVGATGESVGTYPLRSADRPNAAVTTIIIRGLVANAATTLACSDVQIYQGAVSATG